MKLLEKLIYWLFDNPGVCDDTPDSRSKPKAPGLTGMEFDSGEDMLQK